MQSKKVAMVDHQNLAALREKLKEAYRMKIRRETPENTDEIVSVGNDHYGSFFGPSVTIFATRLIQQTDSLSKMVSSNPKSLCSTNKISKTAKIQRLKETRDYSFLFSENQEPNLKPIQPASAQKLDLKKRVSVGESVASTGLRKQETLKKRQNMPKGLLPKTTLGNVESKAKMQQRRKSEPEPTNLKTGVKQAEAIPPKPADVKKIYKPVGEKQPPSCRNFEKRPSVYVKKGVDQKQPSLCRNSENRPSTDVKKGVNQKQPSSCWNSENRPSANVKKGVDLKQSSSCRNSKKRPLEHEDEKAFNILRRMLNMQRFAGRDDSDRVMVASFGDIVKEEKRSERLGRKEDVEQLRLIQEDEKRRQMAKRRRH